MGVGGEYKMGFTAGGLFIRESRLAAQLYLELGDWDLVKKAIIKDNLLQAQALSSLKRYTYELINRICSLSRAELEFLVQGYVGDGDLLLWIALCRYYAFIGNFCREVLHERYCTYHTDLPIEEYDVFFSRQLIWHPELEELTDSSRAKAKSVVFKLMKAARLLSPENIIIPAVPGDGLVQLLRDEGRLSDLQFLPTYEQH